MNALKQMIIKVTIKFKKEIFTLVIKMNISFL